MLGFILFSIMSSSLTHIVANVIETGWVDVLGIVSNAAVNIEVQVSVHDTDLCPLDKHPEVELLNHVANTFYCFEEPLYGFS